MASEETKLLAFKELVNNSIRDAQWAAIEQRNRAFGLLNSVLKGGTLGYYPDVNPEYRLQNPGKVDQLLNTGAQAAGGFIPATKLYGVLRQLARPGFAEAGTGLAEGLGYKAKDHKERLRNAIAGAAGGALPTAVGAGKDAIGVARTASANRAKQKQVERIYDYYSKLDKLRPEKGEVLTGKLKELSKQLNKTEAGLVKKSVEHFNLDDLSAIQEKKLTNKLIDRSNKAFKKYMNEAGQVDNLYHRTPRTEPFTAFKDEYIGSGQGAQALGWGHYATHDEGMHYALQHLHKSPPKELRDIRLELLEELQSYGVENTKSMLHRSIGANEQRLAEDLAMIGDNQIARRNYLATDEAQTMLGRINKFRRDIEYLNSDKFKKIEKIPVGREYAGVGFEGKKEGVDYELLDWNKSVPSKKISMIRKYVGEDIFDNWNERLIEDANIDMKQNDPITGKELYLYLKRISSESALPGDKSLGGRPDEEVSKFLYRVGIKGTRNPVGSLGKKSSSKQLNIVFYNPKDWTKKKTRPVNAFGKPIGDWKPVSINLREAIKNLKKEK